MQITELPKLLKRKLYLSPSARKSWLQILKTALITAFIVGGIAYVENEQKKNKSTTINQPSIQAKIDKSNTNNYQKKISTGTAQSEAGEGKNNDTTCEYKFNLSEIICLTSDLKLLAQVENTSIIFAAILFILGTFDRKKQLERQAWQLIDGAQGSQTSGARRQAIEELYEEGSDITGLDADGADLRGINLSGANLERASFKNAILEEANFAGANLRDADFTEARLQGANFNKAKLWNANFTGARLEAFIDNNEIKKPTDLRDADLGLTTFNQAILSEAIFGVVDSELHIGGNETNLNGAQLRDANLKAVNLNKVCIAEAKFGGAKIDSIETIRKAEKYREAYYSKDFSDAHHDEIKKVDEDYYKDLESQQVTTKKIVEISQRLLSKESLSLQDEDSLSDFVNLLNHLVILFKESNNQCFTENEVLDKVIDIEQKIEERNQIREKLLRKKSEAKKLIEEGKKLIE
ncbi:MAG: pentapeptide repeat-containing protein [Moorea sp. SIO3C2]|nr:pentapeptide repeat-containing protein [Moorena sp. SIO3C2]